MAFQTWSFISSEIVSYAQVVSWYHCW